MLRRGDLLMGTNWTPELMSRKIKELRMMQKVYEIRQFLAEEKAKSALFERWIYGETRGKDDYIQDPKTGRMMGRKPSGGGSAVDKSDDKGYNKAITDEERSFVTKQINTWYHKRYMYDSIIFHYSAKYNAEYTVLNKGFNNYEFLHKQKIKARKK